MLADKGVGQITIRTDAVPVAFVAVESGSDQFRISFAKQNGPIRIALYSDPSEFHHIGVTEHFAPDFEDQGRFVERGTLFCQRQGEAIAAQFQNILYLSKSPLLVFLWGFLIVFLAACLLRFLRFLWTLSYRRR